MGGGRLSMVVLMMMAVAAMQIHSSKAQTTHVVGDSLGWTVPPGGPIAYSTWASLQTFTVGDVLLFNFTTGLHNVAEVRQAAYGPCNANNPVSMSTNGPARITLTTSGTHYFICTVGSHCNLGQKLAINVSLPSTTPPPQPATPPPSSTPPPVSPPVATPPPASPPVKTPAPAPSTRGPVPYIVGDGLGWTVPPGGPIAYQTWAFNKNFMVGDLLVFNFPNGVHNVAEVTRTAFDSCNTTATLSLISTSPARITLTTAGQHYFICTFPNHCSLGQKLAINVTRTRATPPSSIATPPSTSPTPSAPSPVGTTPPSPSSAPSFAVTALPATVLAIALAFLY